MGHSGAPVPTPATLPSCGHSGPPNQRLLATRPVQTAAWGPAAPLSPDGARAVKHPGARREAPAPEQEGWGECGCPHTTPSRPLLARPLDAWLWGFPGGGVQVPPVPTWPPQRHSDSAAPTLTKGLPAPSMGTAAAHRAMLMGAGWGLGTDAPARQKTWAEARRPPLTGPRAPVNTPTWGLPGPQHPRATEQGPGGTEAGVESVGGRQKREPGAPASGGRAALGQTVGC